MKKLLLVLLAVMIAAPMALACDKDKDVDVAKLTAKYRSKGWVGLELDKGEKGPVVARVVENSPAVKAGFKPGDVLLAVNGFKFADKHKKAAMTKEEKMKMKKVKKAFKPGNEVVYVVLRDGAKKKIKVELGQAPDSVIAQWVGEYMMKEAKVEAVAKR